jgi:cysteinyl-tRNA synthetase
VGEAQAALHALAGVLGLTLASARNDAATRVNAAALSKLAARLEVVCGGTDVEATMDALLARRQAARAERDFALADTIRDELAALGVAIEDTPGGARWTARRD